MKKWIATRFGTWQGLARSVLVTLIIYVCCYLILTLLGSYSEVAIISGKTHLFGDVWPVADERVWEPKFTRYRRYDINALGGLFTPLLELDRKFWHKAIREDLPKEWSR